MQDEYKSQIARLATGPPRTEPHCTYEPPRCGTRRCATATGRHSIHTPPHKNEPLPATSHRAGDCHIDWKTHARALRPAAADMDAAPVPLERTQTHETCATAHTAPLAHLACPPPTVGQDPCTSYRRTGRMRLSPCAHITLAGHRQESRHLDTAPLHSTALHQRGTHTHLRLPPHVIISACMHRCPALLLPCTPST